jgi:uncharacterized protein (TIGR00369 family)
VTQECALSDAALLARFANARNRPPCSVALGLEVLALSQSPAWARLAFSAPADWCNPMGAIQGGFVTAMLDEAMAVAGIVAGGLGYVVPTLELKTSFLRPCPPGRLEADGRVLRWGAAAAFLEAELFDPEGRLIAKASATAMPRRLEGKAHPRAAGPG